MPLLIAGFEPWGTHARNPSGELARSLGGHVLPVDYDGAERRLRDLLSRLRPSAILLMGLAPNRREINLEAEARNLDACGDAGWRRESRPIVAGGPGILEARLPLFRIFDALRREGLPAALSRDAGSFICNHVFYVALLETDVPCGFVHLPPEVALRFDDQLRAVRLVATELERAAGGGD